MVGQALTSAAKSGSAGRGGEPFAGRGPADEPVARRRLVNLSRSVSPDRRNSQNRNPRYRSGEKPDEFCDTSTVYLTCLMEMVCALPVAQRNPLLEGIYRRLVLGRADCGTPMPNCEVIDLMTWIPPTDWADRVLTQSLDHEGECVTIQLASFDGKQPTTGDEIADRLSTLVTETRKKRSFKWPEGLPMAVVILACCKHRSPLPPEFWRSSAFPQKVKPQTPVSATA
jgi:hypothetical protein